MIRQPITVANPWPGSRLLRLRGGPGIHRLVQVSAVSALGRWEVPKAGQDRTANSPLDSRVDPGLDREPPPGMNPAIPAQADTLLALGEGPTSAPPHTGQPPMTYLHEKGVSPIGEIPN